LLIKKELGTVPELKYPKVTAKARKRSQFVASAQIVTLEKSGAVLVVDIFGALKRELKLRFFCDGVNFLVCGKWPAEKWITKKPETVLGYGEIASTQKDDDLATDFFNFERDFWKFDRTLGGQINRFIYDLNSEKHNQAMRKKYELRCEHLAMYPVLPADFPMFCERHVFEHTYIFVGKTVKGYRKAACGHCGHESEIKSADAAPGKFGTCLNCRLRAKYRGDWLELTPTDKSKVCIAHKVDNHLLLRWVTVERTFCGLEYQYEFRDYCVNLHIQTPKGKTIYSYRYFYNMGCGLDWYRQQNGTESPEETHIYTYNLNEVFGETYHHVNLQEGLANAGAIAFPKLLHNLQNNPASEYLFKMGLSTLAANLDKEKLKDGKSFREVIDVNPQYLPLYKKYNVTVNEHLVIQASRTWVSFENFEKFRALKPDKETKDIIEALKSMSFERFVNYFTKQKHLLKRKLEFLIMLHRDYIDMSKAMKIDLTRKSLRFPSNIREAHDTILERYNEVKIEVENEVFREATEKLYAGLPEYAKGVFCIVFPKLRSDLVVEGQSLKHCVGNDSYYKNHIEGSKMIFFVRKVEEPEKPFFTMELDMEEFRIKQLYGYCQCIPTMAVKKFADDFVSRLKRSA